MQLLTNMLMYNRKTRHKPNRISAASFTMFPGFRVSSCPRFPSSLFLLFFHFFYLVIFINLYLLDLFSCFLSSSLFNLLLLFLLPFLVRTFCYFTFLCISYFISHSTFFSPLLIVFNLVHDNQVFSTQENSILGSRTPRGWGATVKGQRLAAKG